jgi:choline dehydrogenase-like flavoprotein
MATAPGEVRCAACILPLEGKQVRSLVLQYSPSRFGQTYRDDIARADNVVAYLGTNVVDLETPRPPTQATGAQIACLSGSRFRARARVFVLAGGGVENARLLLLANSVQPAGLGNTHDQVGRYFMEHLYVDRAATVLARAERIGSFYTDGHWSGGRRLADHLEARTH